MKPYYEHGGITIYHGDCLEVMEFLNYPPCDSVITDPPYMIGAHSTGTESSKAGGWGDLMNIAQWYAMWLSGCRKMLNPEGSLWMFGNWRSIPTYMRAMGLAGLPVTSCLVWDKQWIGPAYKNALRPRYEIVMMSARPESEIPDRTIPDITECKWLAGACETTGHKAEKPVELMARLIGWSTRERWLVLDPFCGSGSTLVAAKSEGRRAIGIEIEERYCEIAANRLAQEVLFA